MTSVQQRILAVARARFAGQGFTRTTVSQICREAGVAPATLYRHFASKESLYAAAGRPGPEGAGENPYRQRILEAALDLFSSQGYQGTSMTDVASRAKVSRATLYAQFAGKEALLSAILQEQPAMAFATQLASPSLTGRSARPPNQGAQNGDTPNETARALEVLALKFLRLYEDPRRIALLRLVLAEGNRFPELRHAFANLVQTGATEVARYLVSAAPSLPDPNFTARLYLGGLLSFVLTQRAVPVVPVVYSADEIARQSASFLSTALVREAKA